MIKFYNGMSLEDIEKLRIKVEKDLNSRLFVPLAEEYRKEGMLDEAISVLLDGLDRQPGYTSARVALGRLYLEKDMINEARSEFEKVVSAIPDNLFAHKKLAEIYKDLRESDKAITAYREIIKLNPLDEDAKTCLENLENIAYGPAAETPGTPPAAGAEKAASQTEGLEEEKDISSVHEGAIDVAEEKTGEPEPRKIEEEFEQFKSTFSEKLPEEEAQESEEFFGIPEDQVFDLSAEPAVEDVYEEVAEETTELFEEQPGPVETAVSGKRPDAYMTDAEASISSGNFSKAAEIYKDILSREPDNKRILQRVAELRQLLKLTGRGDETIKRLEAFLDGIKKGRDEFFGNS